MGAFLQGEQITPSIVPRDIEGPPGHRGPFRVDLGVENILPFVRWPRHQFATNSPPGAMTTESPGLIHSSVSG